MKKHQDELLMPLLAGRTLDEQIGCIKRYGNHAVGSVLRDIVLESSISLPKPRETAENLVFFGCYLPFMMPQLLRNYIEILERLGVEYTYLEKEFCCGEPMMETTTGADLEKSVEAGREFMLMNRELAEQKGVKTISYFCIGCAYVAKKYFPNDTIRHLYYPDLIIEKLENKALRVTTTVVGYYEGCHRNYHAFAPEVNLDLARYRKLLDRIEGLEVVDLRHKICCVDYPEHIIEEAEKRHLDTVLCLCPGCYLRLDALAKGRVQMKYFPEMLLQLLE
jgi:Fe-S oxidoreductase